MSDTIQEFKGRSYDVDRVLYSLSESIIQYSGQKYNITLYKTHTEQGVLCLSTGFTIRSFQLELNLSFDVPYLFLYDHDHYRISYNMSNPKGQIPKIAKYIYHKLSNPTIDIPISFIEFAQPKEQS
jgi:hypothetical protein